ncbi:MAG: alcohol dehydrogenase catalytic domain-containing protein [Sphingomonadales bacterium]|nr:alcohol dehydrogenase catalytic domain-containing protein [Sphingomonadales bacterium]
MKAAVCYGSQQALRIEDRPEPECDAGSVLVAVERCGICGSELHLNDGPPRAFAGGMVMGHEFAGRIVEVGSGVSGLRVGQRVAAFPAVGCGHCEACAAGNWILCPGATRILGGFAEFARLPAAAAIPLGDGLTAADGALVEPLTVSLYGIRRAAIQPGDRVLVLGAGTIALSAIYWARRLGAGRIVAMSRSPRRAGIAQAMGADAFVGYGEHERAEVAEALGGAPDIVLECVGVPGMVARAIDHVRLMGKVLSLGFCATPDPIVPAIAGFKGVSLQFPVGYSRQDFEFSARTMLAGHVDPKVMISRVVALDQFPATFARLLGANSENKVQVALAVA